MAIARRSGVALASGALLLTGVLGGCGGEDRGRGAGPLSVTDAVVGATGGTVAAAYMTIHNPGSVDSLVAASSPDARTVTMHVSEDLGGATIMRSADSMEVPAGGSLRLDPGGSHLMVEGTASPVHVGSTVRLHLRFEHSKALDVDAVAVALADLPERIGRR